ACSGSPCSGERSSLRAPNRKKCAADPLGRKAPHAERDPVRFRRGYRAAAIFERKADRQLYSFQRTRRGRRQGVHLYVGRESLCFRPEEVTITRHSSLNRPGSEPTSNPVSTIRRRATGYRTEWRGLDRVYRCL